MCIWITNENSGVVSAWTGIIGTLVSLVFGLWIAISLQKKLTSKRVIKDHLINEVRTLNDFYFHFLNDLVEDKRNVKGLISLFKTMSIKISKLMDIIHKHYEIDQSFLSTYQIGLRNIILGCPEYESGYETGGVLILTQDTINELMTFRQRNEHLFNELILKINSSVVDKKIEI